MKIITDMITWIKTLSLPVKIIGAVSSVALVGGSITAIAVGVAQQNQGIPEATVQIEDENKQGDSDSTNESENDDSEVESTDNEQDSQTMTETESQPTPVVQSQPAQTPTPTPAPAQQQTAQPQLTQPQTTPTPTPRADYNLNENLYFVEGGGANCIKSWYAWGVGKTPAEAIENFELRAKQEYMADAMKCEPDTGMGYSLEPTILTEATCAEHGISCGRW